ncbi:gamma-glutamylcyclotransferase [Paraburkholderia bryophila]|uniref:gamma-glutamylcyclotransferase family protein n=1 Tax=Paraburkholderia bryophila TaxID=420952 RepID=UPI002349FD6B|nr:gamma-glutamylcyclotransferase family protein [Paraburkholderia bryophila]WCM22543.1 gamma-glutamylcyclotransferase [Paraburkholderia bryophila]
MLLDDLLRQDRFAYFAYGSCMNQASLSISLDCAVAPYFVGAALLEGYRLAFNYPSVREPVCCANIEPAAHAVVEGALYELPLGLLDALDVREGVKAGRYARYLVNVRTAQGSTVPALTYRGAVTLPDEAAPSARYRELLVRGFEDAGVSRLYRTHTVAQLDSLRERVPEEESEAVSEFVLKQV